MKPVSNFLIVAIALMLSFAVDSPFVFSKVQVGEEVVETYETTHPYRAEKGKIWEKEFHWPGASYIAIHFSEFNLGKRDYVEISSPDKRYRYIYTGKGKEVLNKKLKKKYLKKFWATHIPGDRAIVTLVGKSNRKGFGFVIDKWVRGYERDYVEALLEEDKYTTIETICGSDDKEWAKCYNGTTIYDKSRTVCRLLINGGWACTGWLLGNEGHVITNYHCIGNQASANNTDYEFMAEGATCATDCTGWFNCPGVVEADHGTFVTGDYDLDYSLILLPTDVTPTYGRLQFRSTLPIIGERIYMPQHPAAGGKQIAVNSDVNGPYATISSTSETPCIGGPGDIGYFADTSGGSSGSPVIATSDHAVVALHHCGGCLNTGVPIPSIISHMGANLPAGAVAGVTPPPSYCSAAAISQTMEWITNVQVGDLNHSSGASDYSDFTSEVAHLTQGSTVNLALTPEFSGGAFIEYWKIWIDYNHDGDFSDPGEEVFSGTDSTTVTGSFTVPVAAYGQTRMRVAMQWGSWPPDCGFFLAGEVEDYTVEFVSYCTSAGTTQNFEWIANVQIGGLSNRSGPLPYSDFTNQTVYLTKGSQVGVRLTPGFSYGDYTEYWKIWIDYNHDSDFTDPGENVFSGSGDSIVSGSFTVPFTAMGGNTRIRVSMRYAGWPTPCGSFNWGEVEDYTANFQYTPTSVDE